MDQVSASTVISTDENARLNQIVEDMVLSNFKESIESAFNNTIYFDAYVKRSALDTRLLANMDQCRLKGIVHDLFVFDSRIQCDPNTYIKRLSKILNKPETDVRTALSMESSKKTLEEDFIKSFQKEAIPLAKNLKAPVPPNACLPYKAYMMIAAPPVDHEALLATLKLGGWGEDESAKKDLLAGYLHYQDRPQNLNQNIPHPLAGFFEEGGAKMKRVMEIAGNDPIVTFAFSDPNILSNFISHTKSISECSTSLTTNYDAARSPIVTPAYTTKLEELTRACTSTDRKCRSRAAESARAFVNNLFPDEEAWRISQNIPACEKEEDFFHKQTTINDVIKAQNEKCDGMGKKVLANFLCKEDISPLREKSVDWELAPKIFAEFGDQAPRILNSYLKKNYCTERPDKTVIAKSRIPYTPLDGPVIDPLRPRSDLTDMREGTPIDYERYNNFLCAKLKAQRPDGTEFSCTENPAPAECENPIYLKHMACTALKQEMDSAIPALASSVKQDILSRPEDDGVAFYERFPISAEHPDQGAMLLEFQRLTNTLPGNLDDNCALPQTIPDSSPSANLGWSGGEFGAGTGTGAQNTGTVFGDYFLAGNAEDQQQLQEFRAANPEVGTGQILPTTPPLPYERRVILPPPENNLAPSLVAPSIPTAAAAPELAADPAIAKLSGSLAERGFVAPSSPSRTSIPLPQKVVAQIISAQNSPTPSPIATPANTKNEEQNKRMKELEEQLAKLKKEEEKLAREGRLAELERLRKLARDLQAERDKIQRDDGTISKITNPNPTPTPSSLSDDSNPIPSTTPLPQATPQNKIAAKNPTGIPQTGANAFASSAGASRNPATNTKEKNNKSPNGFASGISGLAEKKFNRPLPPHRGKPGGLPGIKPPEDHLPYEHPVIFPYELIQSHGLKKIILYFKLEGKTFSALKILPDLNYQIFVYAFNPKKISKKEIETKEEVERRLKVKRLIDELRKSPPEEQKNAGTLSSAADNTFELSHELLLTEKDREKALSSLIPQPILDRAWEDLPSFSIPPPKEL